MSSKKKCKKEFKKGPDKCPECGAPMEPDQDDVEKVAADESAGTCEKRFQSVNVECTEENRRTYRGLLFTTPGANQQISGVILHDETLRQIGMTVVDEYRIDENSRSDWCDIAEKALRMASQKVQEKTSPWPNCSNVIFPLISQAAYEFGSRAYPSLIPGRKVVKGEAFCIGVCQ